MYCVCRTVLFFISYDVFQVRDKRNFLMHHVTMQVTQPELSDVMQTMTDLLNDLQRRHGDPDIPRVVLQIQQVTIITANYFNTFFML